jgi:hypothetical protein
MLQFKVDSRAPTRRRNTESVISGARWAEIAKPTRLPARSLKARRGAVADEDAIAVQVQRGQDGSLSAANRGVRLAFAPGSAYL